MGGRFPLVRQRLRQHRDLVDHRGASRTWIIVEPIHPDSAYRPRHLSTVGRDVAVRSAISVLATPSAANNTIRALVANPAGTVEARVNASNLQRSPSRNCNGRATYTRQLSQHNKHKRFNDTQR